MQGLYPIIRRVRRPLIIQEKPETRKTETLKREPVIPPAEPVENPKTESRDEETEN
jgi:hypothetical protein